MRPPMGSRRRRSEPQTSASLVSEVLAKLGGDDRAREHQAFGSYERAVGALLMRQTQPESLRGTTLFVRVSSSAMAHQLTMLRGEILDRMRLDLGDGVVSELRTRVGVIEGPA